MANSRDPQSSQSDTGRPPLSYVLAAATEEEVHNVAQWLWRARLSAQIELVLAAPAVVLSWIAGRLIPPRVRI
ncbi:MAG: hypothetical protein ABI647_20910, partial [Gemmatimonadota bacterium]